MTPFGQLASGETVHAVTIRSAELSATILTYGAILQDLRLAGVDHSLTLGSARLSDYEGEMCYYGALIGPLANRIGGARVKIDGMMYELERNENGQTHLHSGSGATQGRNWQIAESADASVTLVCDLADGDAGLPGNRQITATFAISGQTLSLDVTGTTDAPTLMNFANHAFWNLDGTETWDGHRLQIEATARLPLDSLFVPTGEIEDITGTRYDLRKPRRVSPELDVFDFNYCLSDQNVPLREVLQLTGQSGVQMTLATDQPGLQVFDNRVPNRPGRSVYEGLAIEPQGWPDAPNHRHFPSWRVTPGAPYRQTSTFRFTKA